MRNLASCLRRLLAVPVAAAGLTAFGEEARAAYEWDLNQATWLLSGYMRQYLSINTEDTRDFPAGNTVGEVSMSRTQIRADLFGQNLFELPAGGVDVFASLRLVGEQRTDYQDALATPTPIGFSQLRAGAFNAIDGEGPFNNAGFPVQKGDYTEFYQSYQFPLREFYVDVPLYRNLNLRFGKQQVAWGESDFFQGSDLVHGFDFSWRSFLEAENEELRKPLILANLQYQVPAWNGAFTGIIRPGWDREADIGTTFDLHGGRWASAGTRGIDFINFLNYNYDHPDADKDDVTGGLRWQGLWRDFNYSLQWIHNFNPEPVTNSCAFGPACIWNTPVGPGLALRDLAPNFRGPLNGIEPTPGPVQLRNPYGIYLGDIIYPIVDTLGVTASTYVPAIDVVLSSELAYTIDKPFATGSTSAATTALVPVAGLAGVRQKDILRIMLRADYQAKFTQRLPGFLATPRPAFLSVQLFDTWIPDFRDTDDLVNVGYGRRIKEHSPLLTGLFNLPYWNDRLVAGFAFGLDLQQEFPGNGFFAPSLEWVYGDHVRIKAEYDLFWDSGSESGAGCGKSQTVIGVPGCTTPQRILGSDTGVFGFSDGADQVLVRFTYQY